MSGDDAEVAAYEARVNGALSAHATAFASWLRPQEATAYRCAGDRLADAALPLAAAHAAGEACMEGVQATRERFATEMAAVQRALHDCHSETEKALKAQFSGGREVDNSSLVTAYMARLRPCAEKTLATLPASLERVKAPPKESKKGGGWFA
jgi:hypothetical protein